MLDWHRQAQLWESLASTLDAGLPPDRALALAADAAGGTPGRRARLAAMRVATGTPLSEALAAAGEEPFACAVIHAGDSAGRLPPLARQLAEAYRLRARLRDESLSRLVYPTILVHLALLLLPLPWVFQGKLPWWTIPLGPLLVWAAVFGLLATTWWSHRSGLLGRLALRKPLSLLCWPALAADLAAVLRAAIGAGMLAPTALELAAGACANQTLSARLNEAAVGLRQKRIPDLTAALATCGLAGDLLELVRTGEASGKLEEGLGHARTVAAERFRWRLEWTVRCVNGAIYGIALLTAAAVIVTMFSNYYGQIRELAESET